MKIIVTPDKFLRHVAKPVAKLDKKLETEIAEMIITLKEAKNPQGVGLAATQVGLDRRLFIITFSGKPEIFINPTLTNLSQAMLSDVYKKAKDRWLEGCLSIPKLWGFVDRHYSVEVDYLTPENGVLVPRHRKFEDDQAAYIQHENDHINGVLFTDHILEQGGQLFEETKNGLVPVKI